MPVGGNCRTLRHNVESLAEPGPPTSDGVGTSFGPEIQRLLGSVYRFSALQLPFVHGSHACLTADYTIRGTANQAKARFHPSLSIFGATRLGGISAPWVARPHFGWHVRTLGGMSALKADMGPYIERYGCCGSGHATQRGKRDRARRGVRCDVLRGGVLSDATRWSMSAKPPSGI